MSTLRETLDDLRRSLTENPDELLVEVGAGGEVLLARLRRLVAILLLALPAINLALGGGSQESLSGLVGAGAVLALSQLWLALAQQRQRQPWLPFVSAGFDVTLVTLVLLLLGLESPVAGLNSMVVWACYPLAILATALRNDLRVTLATGALALLQSALLAVFLLGLAGDATLSADYGKATLSIQAQRLVLLALVTLVTAVIVFRTQRLVQMSGTDGLTGLPNRSFLNQRVPQLLADAEAEGHTLTLALIDLDHFRFINQELGHLAGDRALRHVVSTLRTELGRGEPMMRVGGEEFVLLLRMPIGAAWERMEALRRRLESLPFVPEADVEPRRLTLSAGLACSPQDARDLSGLMRRADLRLRAAKEGGRNRIVARDGN